jgi:hypothetical protein
MFVPQIKIVKMKNITPYISVQFKFLILKYHLPTYFTTNPSSYLIKRLYNGIVSPYRVAKSLLPGKASPKLQTLWYAGERLIFNQCHYF